MKTTVNCLIPTTGSKFLALFTDRPDGADLPMEFGPVLKWGVNDTTKGPVRMGEKTRRVFSANQKRLGFEEVALDFEHNTVPGTKAYAETQEPRPVAAYGSYELRQDGLYFRVNRWTPDGVKSARNYADLSPAVGPADTDEVEFAHSLALVRQGSVYGLHAFAVDLVGGEIQNEEETLMDKVMEMLRKALGLKADATDQEIVDGLKGVVTLSARLQTAEQSLTALSSDVGSVKTDAGKVGSINAALAALQGELATMKSALAKSEKALACYHARLEGKVIPLSADAIDQMDIKALNETIAKLPAGQVPVVALSAGGQEPAGSAKALTEQDIRIGKELGFTEEQLKTANGLK